MSSNIWVATWVCVGLLSS